MPRRTRAEVEAENLVLYRELEALRDRLDHLLESEEDHEPAEGHADPRYEDDAAEQD